MNFWSEKSNLIRLKYLKSIKYLKFFFFKTHMSKYLAG